MEPTILVADNDSSIVQQLEKEFGSAGFSVLTAKDGKQAMELLEEHPVDTVLTDLLMPRMNGLELLKWVKSVSPSLPVIIMTAHGTIENAIEAAELGAYDYVVKPFNFTDLMLRIRKAVDRYKLATRIENLEDTLHQVSAFEEIIGRSRNMQDIFRRMAMVAKSDATVMIYGESGTRKELVARGIHRLSARKDGPFVPVSCGALPTELLENELFGHVRGAYTGAHISRKGLLEEAHRGTLFLDEIGEMSPAIQVKLLRVIQEREFRPLGSTNTVKVDVRILGATNQDLAEAVKEGTFREDLYFRLNVISIILPPLRERKEDIPLLANHFLKKYSQREGKTIREFTPEVMHRLIAYPWPGNVRELENKVEQAVVMASHEVIGLHDVFFPEDMKQGGFSSLVSMEQNEFPSFKEAKQAFEREYIIQVLKMNQGNVSQAAKQARKDRKDFYAVMKKYNIDPDAYRRS